ncbi:MAG: TonB-dependent receptor [Pseudomonadota bacterium]
MPKREFFKHVRFGTTALGLVLASQGIAFAQESPAEETTATDDGEFLGTVTLGESKREVQTDTPVALTVIGKEEIDDRQANTIAELIDSVPGVTLVNGSTPSGSGINIRGFGANGTFGTDQKVAVVVDGANTGAEEIYRIGTQLFTDPFLYRSVSVQRGTIGSYEYGTGIVGGIVLLETVDASDLTGGVPGFKAGLTVGAGTNKDQLNGSATLAWQASEQLELLGNFSYREQSNQDDGNGDEIGNSAFELPSFLLKGRYSFGQDMAHSIMASFTQTDTSERDVPYDSFFTTTDAFGNVDRDITSQTASLFYTYAPAGSDLIDLEVGLTYANQEIDSSYVPGSSSLEANPFFGPVVIALGDADHQYETTRFTIKNNSYIETGPFAHDLRYGLELQERDRVDEQSAPGGTDNRFALFVVDDIALTDNLYFTPALRYESSEIEGTIPDPDAPPQSPFAPPMPTPEITRTADTDALVGGASLRYEFGNGFTVFGSYAYTESLPIIDDLESLEFFDQPELSETWEGGFSYDKIGVFGDDALALKVNYYDTNLDDVTSYSGAEEIDITGLEIETSYARFSGFYVDLNANFVTGEESQVSVIDINGTPTRVLDTTIDWDRTPQDSIRATFGQRFGEFADVSAEILTAFDRDINTGTSTLEADSFTIVNLRATLAPQEGFLEGTEFRFGLENAFDEDYTPFLATRPAVGQNFKLTVSRLF